MGDWIGSCELERLCSMMGDGYRYLHFGAWLGRG